MVLFSRISLGVFISIAIGATSLSAHDAIHAEESPDALYARIAIVDGAVGPATDAFDLDSQLRWLREREFDVAGIVLNEGYIELVVTRLELEGLRAAGFDILESRALGALADAPERALADYADPGEVNSFLQQVESDHPNITLLYVIGTTVEGRDILAMEISNNPGVDEDEPAILFNAQHHAREVATPHIVMDVIDTLTTGYQSGDSQIRKWVDNNKIVCVPSVNPDGTNYVFTANSGWRKNRSFNSGGSRGVDLNRNYPYHWGSGTLNCERGTGSSGTPSSDTYRGPSAGSEPETQTMIGLANDWNFVMAVSYHASGQFIDYPYACNDGNPDLSMPEHDVIDDIMKETRDAIFAVDGVFYSVFSPVAISAVNGDDTSWYYAHAATYASIIEVGTSFIPPISSLPGIIARNRGGWMYQLGRLGGSRIDLYVRDAITLQPLSATVTLTDFVYDTDEWPRTTKLPHGRHTWLVPGSDTYTAMITLDGYDPQSAMITVGANPVALTVDLQPETIAGDIDLDGDVDLVDFITFAECFGALVSSPPPSCSTAEAQRSDMDGSGTVSLNDFLTFAANFGS